MKKILILALSFLIFKFAYTQEVIGTPKGFAVAYNLPDHYFYLQLNGVDKRETDKAGVYVVDGKAIQILVVNKKAFMDSTAENVHFVRFISRYISWESAYIKQNFGLDLKYDLEIMKSPKGKDLAFWSYNAPLSEPTIAKDGKQTSATITQLFVLTRYKDYMIGISAPLFEPLKFEDLKNYLIECADSRIDSPLEIDVLNLGQILNR